MIRSALVALLLVAACASVPRATPADTVDAFVDGLVRGDVDAIVATLADDATVFLPMASAPRRLAGRESVRAALAALGMQPGSRIVPRDVDTRLYGGVAVVTFHLGSGDAGTSFSRRTFVLRRDRGVWRIVHLHASNVMVPGPR